MAQQHGSLEAVLQAGLRPRTSRLKALGRIARQQPLGTVGMLVAMAFLGVAIFAPWIETYDPLKLHKDAILVPPNSTWYFGTDNIGRDIFSRVVEGARISVLVGFISPVIIQGIALLIAIPGAYFGGKTDLILQRYVDAMSSIPTLVLLLALVSVLTPSLTNVIIAIGVTRGPGASRVIRSQALRVKEEDYVLAARGLGATNIRIMARHIFPQVIATMLVLISVEVPGAIIAEAGLSFLGLGVPQPAPSWGSMLSGVGREYLLVAPWIAIAPGIAISVLVFAFNMFGDTMRDLFDPRLRGARS